MLDHFYGTYAYEAFSTYSKACCREKVEVAEKIKKEK